MSILSLESFSVTTLPDGAERAAALVRVAGVAQELTIQVRGRPAARSVDPFVPLVLMRAMRDGHALHIVPPVSARLLAALPRALDILCSFEPLFHRPEIDAHPAARARAASGEAAALFSGGVDSFYTLLKHRDELQALVLAHGFDMRLEDAALRERVAAALRRTAAAAGLPMVELETNARPFVERRDAPGRTGKWTMVQGAVLASFGLVLAPTVERLFVASGAAYGALVPWGTHPLLDPLWSTEEVEIVHDGCEATRLQKVRRLSTSDLALGALRVCFKNPGGAYNCGACDKCIRTMVELRAVGALERCDTFAQPLSLARLRQQRLDRIDRIHLGECLRVLQAEVRDRELQRVLDRMLRRRDLGRRALGVLQGMARDWRSRLLPGAS